MNGSNGDGLRPGWLVEQLPRVMAEDHFTARFVGIFEEIAGGLRARVSGFQHDLDVGMAPPAFVRWMGAWLGFTLDPSQPEEHQRSLVAAAGRLFPLRGTREGLRGLLEAFTRSTVEVSDGGGVFREGQAPASAKHVVVKMSDTGGLAETHLLELIRTEIPADATFELRVGRRKVQAEVGPQEDLGATVEVPRTEAGPPPEEPPPTATEPPPEEPPPESPFEPPPEPPPTGG